MSSDDPDCQDLFDGLAEAGMTNLPDAVVLFMGEDPGSGSIYESIHVGPVGQALADAQAALDCAKEGFTVQFADPEGEPTLLDFVSTPMDVEVAGWDIVARRTHSPTGDTPGGTANVLGGRDGLLIALEITAESVPTARVQQLTSTALQRAQAELLDSPQ
jgi:hypothetical protein